MHSEKFGNSAEITVSETCRLESSAPPHDILPHDVTQASNSYAHVEPHPFVKALLGLADILLAASPLIFLGIACAAIAYDGKLQDKRNLIEEFDPTSGRYIQREAVGTEKLWLVRGGNTVIAAAGVAVSIFPIVFAAIVGRFLKSYSMYRAERGASMGMLEQLYGSQNLANAVHLTYALRGSGIVGVSVIVLWLLSPLGGQATQRVLSTRTIYNSSYGNVYYANTGSTKGAFLDHLNKAIRHETTQALLSVALLSDSFTESNDIYGNPKIPFLESLDTTNEEPARIANGSATLYPEANSPSSSMIGLLINNVTNSTTSYFTTKSSYVNLTCESPRTWNYSDVCAAYNNAENMTDQQFKPYYDFLAWANLLTVLPNGSTVASVANDSDSTQDVDPTFWTTWTFNLDVQTNGTINMTGAGTGTDEEVETFSDPPTFIYSAQNAGSCFITAWKCPSRLVWVESDIVCDAGSVCRVQGMRNSSPPSDVEAGGIFNQSYSDNGHHIGLRLMLDELSIFASSGPSGVANPIEWYLTGSPSSFRTEGYPDYSEVSTSLLTTRLATLINTYWMAGLQSAATGQPPSTNASLISDSQSNSTTYGQSAGLEYDVVGTYAQFWTAKDVYTVNWPFAIIAIIISLMLLVFGFYGIHLRRKVTYPDILGSVSTLTRENPNFEAPIDGYKSNGLELAAYYRKMKVELVNTSEGNEAGRLHLRPVRRNSVS